MVVSFSLKHAVGPPGPDVSTTSIPEGVWIRYQKETSIALRQGYRVLYSNGYSVSDQRIQDLIMPRNALPKGSVVVLTQDLIPQEEK